MMPNSGIQDEIEENFSRSRERDVMSKEMKQQLKNKGFQAELNCSETEEQEASARPNIHKVKNVTGQMASFGQLKSKTQDNFKGPAEHSDMKLQPTVHEFQVEQ